MEQIYILYDTGYNDSIDSGHFFKTLEGAMRYYQEWYIFDTKPEEWIQEGPNFWRYGDTDNVIESKELGE
jgi:hypothetical protein